MRNSIYIIGILLLLGTISCYEDLGNYTYGDKQIIMIDSLKKQYTGYSGDILKITPVITSDRDIVGYEWSVYDSTAAAGKITILDSVKDLDYTIVLPQGLYQLLFKVTDTEGYTEIATSLLNVYTTYSEGFYVLKEIQGESDLDLYPTGKSPVRDLLYNLHNRRLEGKPEGLFIAPQHKYIDSVSQKEFVLFPISEQESPMIRLQDMQPVFSFEELFYSSPMMGEKPQKFINGSDVSQALLTDKHVYSYACIYPNISGKFGDYAYFETDMEPSPYVALDRIFPNLIMFYDNLTGQFLNLNQFNMISRFKDTSPENQERSVAPYDLNCKMVYMRQVKAGQKAYAILQHKETAERYLVELQIDAFKGSEINPIVKVDTLPADLHIYQAENFTISENLVYLYYNVGCQIYLYDIAAGTESPLSIEIEGEKITMLDYLYWRKPPVTTQWDYFVTATYTQGNYKLYLFKTRGDQPDTSQEPILQQGEGKVKTVQYVNPYMTTNMTWYPYN